MPIDMIINDALKITLAFEMSFSSNDFARKREEPAGIPIAAITVNIVAREMAVEEVPMTSEDVILVNTNHKRIPESNLAIVSTKIYAAPLPTTFPPSPVTLDVITLAVYKCAI